MASKQIVDIMNMFDCEVNISPGPQMAAHGTSKRLNKAVTTSLKCLKSLFTINPVLKVSAIYILLMPMWSYSNKRSLEQHVWCHSRWHDYERATEVRHGDSQLGPCWYVHSQDYIELYHTELL